MCRTPTPASLASRALLVLCTASLGACDSDPTTALAPGRPVSTSRASTATVGAAPAARSTYVAALRRRLERAADGLLYTSESDYPFEYVFFAADARPPLTAAAFRAAAHVPADSLVEAMSLDQFFARHIERVDPNDPAAVALVPRYRALKRTIRTSVRDARVFRVGRVAIRCHVVGIDALGNVVGLATTAIET